MDDNNVNPNQAAHEAADALMDFSFKKFITIRVVKLLYILMIALIALEWLIGVVAGFNLGGFGGGLGAMITMTLMAVIQLIFARILLELIVVIFRIGENTSEIAASKRV
jgi:uncharacterized membrane protein